MLVEWFRILGGSYRRLEQRYLRLTLEMMGAGRTGVRWRPGQETSLTPPHSDVRSFGSKCAILEKVLVTLLGLFGAPPSPLVTPVDGCKGSFMCGANIGLPPVRSINYGSSRVVHDAEQAEMASLTTHDTA